jgi:hypothetical protein
MVKEVLLTILATNGVVTGQSRTKWKNIAHLERDGVDDALALYLLQSCLNDLKL